MLESPAGSPCPHATITWLSGTVLAAGASATIGATPSVACNGAKVGQLVEFTPRTALATAGAGGVAPYIYGYVPAADTVSLVASNPTAATAITPGADIVFDVVCLPPVP